MSILRQSGPKPRPAAATWLQSLCSARSPRLLGPCAAGSHAAYLPEPCVAGLYLPAFPHPHLSYLLRWSLTGGKQRGCFSGEKPEASAVVLRCENFYPMRMRKCDQYAPLCRHRRTGKSEELKKENKRYKTQRSRLIHSEYTESHLLFLFLVSGFGSSSEL